MTNNVLIDLGNIRIIRYDHYNVKVEHLENVYIPSTNEIIHQWTFKGYSRSILEVLLLKKLTSNITSL